MCRTILIVVSSVWAVLNTVAAQETPRAPRRFSSGSERRSSPAWAEINIPADESPAGAPSQPPPFSRPANQPMPPQVLVEPVPVVSAQAGTQHKRLVVPLKSMPANELASTLNSMLRAEGRAGPAAVARGVVLVPDKLGKSLLIGGPREAVEEVCRLVEELDRPAVMVLLEMVLAEAPAGNTQAAQTKTLARFRLVATNNQTASLAFGSREPALTGVTVTPTGTVSTVEYRPLGTILGITPRIRPDETVVFEISISHSRSGLQDAATRSGGENSVVLSAPIESLEAGTTLCLRAGETAMLDAQWKGAKAGGQGVKAGRQVSIQVTPHVLQMFTNP